MARKIEVANMDGQEILNKFEKDTFVGYEVRLRVTFDPTRYGLMNALDLCNEVKSGRARLLFEERT